MSQLLVRIDAESDSFLKAIDRIEHLPRREKRKKLNIKIEDFYCRALTAKIYQQWIELGKTK